MVDETGSAHPRPFIRRLVVAAAALAAVGAVVVAATDGGDDEVPEGAGDVALVPVDDGSKPGAASADDPTSSTVPSPSTGFPDASTTGPSGTLTPMNGSITTSRDGQVLENFELRNGSIFIQHDNVVIRNFRILQPGGQAITNHGNTGLVVENCEIDGTGNPDGAAVIGDHNYTMRRCEVRNFGEGPRSNGNVLIEDNYLHTFTDFISQGAHQDCIQITSGSGTVIRHNTCLMNVDGGNAAIMTGSFSGSDLVFENNLLAGGGYTVYCGGTQYSNVRVVDNRFSTRYYPRSGYYAPLLNCEQATLSGNVWHESGRSL